ncbi:helix-turn-helix domain-containing protein [Comamonas sp. Z1]|uniref:helix-turn-helix domain-containing protein n=1 Tax=Comamonas sp. Z1 TaxID=2601246 RepID=UPI002104E1E6|nr:helix-turn-helix domain-containing protein [Comamonas sp. Z1]
MKFQQAFITSLNMPNTGMFPQLSPNQWIRFLQHFSTLLEPDRKGKTGQIAGLQHLSTAISAIQLATQMLANWPSGFHALLTKIQAHSDISFSISRTFGNLYRWLYDDLSDQAFSFLREAFETYLQEHWWGLVCQRNMRIKPNQRGAQRTTLREAATSAGVSPTRIKQLHLNGLVEATSIAHSNGRHSWTLPPSAVERLASLASDGISLKSASQHLALPRHRIRELIEAGLIHPRLCPNSHGSSAWLLSREELDQLGCSVRLNAAAALPRNEGEDTVSIVQILRGWRLAVGAFPALIAALSANQVEGVGAKPQGIPLGAMRIPVRGLRAWLRQWEQSHMQDMSIATAARILGIKEQVAYELVRSGLLHEHRMPSSHSRRIAKASIEHFQNTYVSAVEIGKKMHMSTKLLIEHLNVQPVAGPHVNGCRQYFLNREDVKNTMKSIDQCNYQ